MREGDTVGERARAGAGGSVLVGAFERFFLGAVRHDRDHRSELLLIHDPDPLFDAGDDGGRIEISRLAWKRGKKGKGGGIRCIQFGGRNENNRQTVAQPERVR